MENQRIIILHRVAIEATQAAVILPDGTVEAVPVPRREDFTGTLLDLRERFGKAVTIDIVDIDTFMDDETLWEWLDYAKALGNELVLTLVADEVASRDGVVADTDDARVARVMSGGTATEELSRLKREELDARESLAAAREAARVVQREATLAVEDEVRTARQSWEVARDRAAVAVEAADNAYKQARARVSSMNANGAASDAERARALREVDNLRKHRDKLEQDLAEDVAVLKATWQALREGKQARVDAAKAFARDRVQEVEAALELASEAYKALLSGGAFLVDKAAAKLLDEAKAIEAEAAELARQAAAKREQGRLKRAKVEGLLHGKPRRVTRPRERERPVPDSKAKQKPQPYTVKRARVEETELAVLEAHRGKRIGYTAYAGEYMEGVIVGFTRDKRYNCRLYYVLPDGADPKDERQRVRVRTHNATIKFL